MTFFFALPQSLKKEIDCSEDDNSNSRHMHLPRSASAGGGLGGDLDYRLTTHESVSANNKPLKACPFYDIYIYI